MRNAYSEHPSQRSNEAAREGWRDEISRLARRENAAAARRPTGRIFRPDMKREAA